MGIGEAFCLGTGRLVCSTAPEDWSRTIDPHDRSADAERSSRSSVPRQSTEAVRLGLLASVLFLLGLAAGAALLPQEASGDAPACPSPLAQTVSSVRGAAPPAPHQCEEQRRGAMVLLSLVLAGPVPAVLALNLVALVRRGGPRAMRAAVLDGVGPLSPSANVREH